MHVCNLRRCILIIMTVWRFNTCLFTENDHPTMSSDKRNNNSTKNGIYPWINLNSNIFTRISADMRTYLDRKICWYHVINLRMWRIFILYVFIPELNAILGNSHLTTNWKFSCKIYKYFHFCYVIWHKNNSLRSGFHHENKIKNKNKNKLLETFPFVPMSIQIRNAKRTCKNK